MRRKETTEKLDRLTRTERSMWTIAGIVALLVFAALAMGYYAGEDLGETNAIVRYASLAAHHKTGDWYSKIQVEFDNGTSVAINSPHTPPPQAGERIVLHLRRNLFGWRTYSWEPSATPPPGKATAN